jgi:signal transduction histidine kinase
MQLHVAVDQPPANSPAKLGLSRVLELIRHVMEEGRNAIRGLRSSNSDSDDLGQAFSRIPARAGDRVQIDFRAIVLGSARKLHSLIRDEICRIGREVLVNAFRHSRASCIEIEIAYAPRRLRIVVATMVRVSILKCWLRDARDIGDSQVCANRRKKLAPDSEFGGAPRPEQKSSCPSLIPSPSNPE